MQYYFKHVFFCLLTEGVSSFLNKILPHPSASSQRCWGLRGSLRHFEAAVHSATHVLQWCGQRPSVIGQLAPGWGQCLRSGISQEVPGTETSAHWNKGEPLRLLDAAPPPPSSPLNLLSTEVISLDEGAFHGMPLSTWHSCSVHGRHSKLFSISTFQNIKSHSIFLLKWPLYSDSKHFYPHTGK